MNDEMTPAEMKAAADGLREQLAGAISESVAIIGWHGVFRAIRDAATLQEVGYVRTKKDTSVRAAVSPFSSSLSLLHVH